MIRRACFVFVCALFLSACFAIREFAKPEISLVNAQLTNISLFETSAEFTVRMDNDTPEIMEFKGATHRFYVNGEYIGKGYSNKELVLNPLSSSTSVVDVNLNNLSIAGKLQSWFEATGVSYKIESVFYPKNSWGRVRVVDSNTFNPRL